MNLKNYLSKTFRYYLLKLKGVDSASFAADALAALEKYREKEVKK